SGSVDVHCHAGPQHVRVEIVDTGAGIASDRLTAMLARAAGSARPRTTDAVQWEEDTGERGSRGLAIVQYLARVLDCTLEVESAPGLGSRFAVIAPRDFGSRGRLRRHGDG